MDLEQLTSRIVLKRDHQMRAVRAGLEDAELGGIGTPANGEPRSAPERGRRALVHLGRRQADARRQRLQTGERLRWQPRLRQARATRARRLVGAEEGGHVGRQHACVPSLLTRALARVQGCLVPV